VASGDDAIRIRKREEKLPVDGIVAVSMASWRWHDAKPTPKYPGKIGYSGLWGRK
jgi:hypothetical protein